jgi:hypothetical protein
MISWGSSTRRVNRAPPTTRWAPGSIGVRFCSSIPTERKRRKQPVSLQGEQRQPRQPGGQKSKTFRIKAGLNTPLLQICRNADVFSEIETGPIGSLRSLRKRPHHASRLRFHRVNGFRC